MDEKGYHGRSVTVYHKCHSKLQSHYPKRVKEYLRIRALKDSAAKSMQRIMG